MRGLLFPLREGAIDVRHVGCPVRGEDEYMRWMWIDRIDELESGRRVVAVKNVTRAEEHLHDPLGGYPVMPASLIIEGMAQTAGILAGEAHGFARNVILAKIKNAEFSDHAVPGDQLRYEAVLDSLDDRAAATRGTVYKNGAPIGRVDLIFSYLDPADKPREVPDHNFVFGEPFMDLLAAFRTRTTRGGDPSDAH